MSELSPTELEALKEKKTELLKEFLAQEPPKCKGDDLVTLWEKLYDADMRKATVETLTGESTLGLDSDNFAFPYQQIRAVVGDGENWKWPRMWQRLDEIERRGTRYRAGEIINFQHDRRPNLKPETLKKLSPDPEQPGNKNPDILPQRCLVVGGGPIGMRMALELVMGGHNVTLIEKRREIRGKDGDLTQLGFTNRINRPHMWAYVRNDLEKFNGKDFMSRQACYPVFTEPDTSSIGIDELQCLLLKNVLMMGVDFRFGVGYEDASTVVDDKSQKPSWRVKLTYDDHAQGFFGKPAVSEEVFDCLIGCDGPRSTVRETQQKLFGNIEKRKFMDCVGIVGNVQKLSRKRLKELNYPHGQEPSDMNRTAMVFGDFFAKLKAEAKCEIQNFIYYKASFHNYVIITPTRANLIEHGLSGKVYSFGQGRSAEAIAEMAREKEKLKKYTKKILEVGGIPMDPELSNEGFVDPPNDCMAFDFAECWNTKKSMNFDLAYPDWDVAEHGKWMGPKLTPFIALAGDALLEPFWPLGLGLKRGWQAIMDTAYAIDNMYNRTMYCAELNKNSDEFSWEMHWETLKERTDENFQLCSRADVCEDLGKGEYLDGSVVLNQWKKFAGDLERPLYLVEVDPNCRYKKRNLTLLSQQKRWMLDDKDWRHPVVTRFMNIADYTEKCKKDESYRGWNKLLSYGGRKIGAPAKSGYTFKAPGKKAPTPASAKPVIPAAAVAQVAERKRSSLHAAVTADAIASHIEKPSAARKNQMEGAQAGLLAALKKQQGNAHTADDMHKMAYDPSGEGQTERAEKQWSNMQGNEDKLSREDKRALEDIRDDIKTFEKKLQRAREAEREILMKVV